MNAFGHPKTHRTVPLSIITYNCQRAPRPRTAVRQSIATVVAPHLISKSEADAVVGNKYQVICMRCGLNALWLILAHSGS